ncbi:MAG: calcium-binding protein [Nitrospira sp.]|jgi:Ca2+-binding RTX toxin-like protein|nr:calcium-binding protein [Nitrospira sp.]
MADPVKTYFDFSQAAMAAYADLGIGSPAIGALTSAGFSNQLAGQFASTYTVKSVSGTFSGFGFSATLFESPVMVMVDGVPTTQKILSIRGTDDLADLLIDAVSIGILGSENLNPQYGKLKAYVDDLYGSGTLKPTDKLIVTGHSLGGFLAQALAVDPAYASRIDSVYTYNAPGFGGAFTDLLNALGISNPLAGSAPIGQVTNLVASNGLSPIAGLGQHIGATKELFIEAGDPLHNHSIITLTDSLALYNLFATIAPAVNIDDLTGILNAAGTAGGSSLEVTVDALQSLFQLPAVENAAVTHTTPLEDQDRDAYYEVIDNVASQFLPGPYVVESLVSQSADALAAKAEQASEGLNPLAYRYALTQLNPFVIHEADYDRHNEVGELDLYNDATGTGTLTGQYLADRAQFLAEKIALNLDDRESSSGTILYEDRTLVYTIGTNSVFAADQRFLFGSDASEADLNGGSEEDHLYGGGGSDHLDGQAGRDYLEGNGGTDILLGGAGRDILLGQQGFDRLEGGEDDDRLAGGPDTDELLGDAGLDVYYLQSGGGRDTITDSDGRGVIQVDQRLLVGGIRKPDDAADTYTSLDGRFRYVRAGSTLTIANLQSAGDQIIIENYSPGQLGLRLVDVAAVAAQDNGLPLKTNDSFLFGEIDDTSNVLTLDGLYNFAIDALGGDDYVVAGAGNDSLSGSGGGDTLFGMGGTDFLYGGAEADTLLGGNEADSIHGDEGADTLLGEDGSDWLLGGEGDDDLDGGDGQDFLDAEEGTGYQILSGGVGNDVVIGGAGKDSLYGDERDGSRISEGGDDLLYAGTGSDGGDIQYGLQGDAGSDIVVGADGDDKLLGDGFNNVSIFWDPAYDGQDWLDGGRGNDVLIGGGNDDILAGGIGNDRLIGDYSNIFFALGGSDLLDGGDGADTLVGGMGNDTLYGGADGDVLRGDNESVIGAGSDGGDDFLDGEAGDDNLSGGAGNDVLLGGLGDDSLYGEDGSDYLDGGAGVDILDGGAGFDTIHGGSGNDRLLAGGGTIGSSGEAQAFFAAAIGSEPLAEGAAVAVTAESAGMDQLFGDAGDDYLISGAESLDTGNSLLVGGRGDDTYEIDSLGDVVVEAAGEGRDSVISYLSAYTLLDHFENLSFRGLATSGVGNNLDNVMSGARSLEGLGGNDTLNGVGFLDGGVGDDLLQGRSGFSFFNDDTGQLEYLANTYVFRPGDGRDTIQENDALFNSAYYQNEDRVMFADGIASSDVTWERAGNDLLLHVGVGADQITVTSFYDLRLDRGGYLLTGAYVPPEGSVFTPGGGLPAYVAPSRVELVEFADGIVWNADHFGGPLLGDFRADTYRFGRGSGEVTVLDLDVTQSNIDREQDRILIGAGVLPSEVTLARTNGDDLVLSINGTSDRLTVKSFFRTITVVPPFSFSGYSVAAYRIEQVQFTDGTVWTVSDLFNRLSIFVGTAGADTLFGNPLNNLLQGLGGDDYLSGQGGDDVLDGGEGNDRLYGDAGNDTYLFGRGGGQDILVSVDSSGSDVDVVRLGEDVLPSEVTIQVEGTSNDLVVRINGTSDQVLLDEFLWRADYQIDQLIFGDGTVWDSAMILDRAVGLTLTGTETDNTLRGSVLDDVLIGLGGNDLLVGNEGDDRLFGGLGNDELSGDTGDDTYVFNLGDGIDTIYDETVPGEANRIVFGTGLAAGDLSFVRNEAARTLTIQVGSGGTDRLVLEGFDPTGLDGSLVASMLEFADGSALNLADLFPLNQAPSVANALTDQTVPEDAPLTVEVPANAFADADAGDTLTYNASLADGTALPTWLTFDPATRTFSGTPDDAQVGSLALTVTAIDTGNLSASDTFTLTVQNVNEAPTVAAPLADQQVTQGTPFAFVVQTATWTDEDALHGDTLTYNATRADDSALPSWLTFDPLTRTFSGTPQGPDIGMIEVRVTATDSGALSASNNFALTVLPITGTAGNDSLTGTGGDDVIEGLAGDDTLAGLAGNDLLTGGVGADWLMGGEGDDTVQLSVDGVWGAGYVAKNSGSPGSAGTGQIVSLTGKNRSFDVLQGDAGVDRIVGSAGDDVLALDDAFSPFPGTAGPRVSGVELIDVGDGHDVVDLTSATYGYGDVTLLGGTGDDMLWSNAGNDRLEGGAGNDNLYGGAGVDYLLGGEGNDTLDGAGGADTLVGGLGNDTYLIDTVNDAVSENVNEGTDTVKSSISYALGANLENLTLIGTVAVTGTGNTFNNVLRGNSAANVLTGGAGNDTYVVSMGDTVVENANEGIDTVQSDVSWALGANLEHLTLTGNAAINATGNSAANTLIGNGAANQLAGGAGNDTLKGGLGNDTYVVNRSEGRDVIAENDGTAGNRDLLLYGATINPLDLVLSRQVNDLRLAIHGGTDSVTIQNWYSAPTTAQVETIQAGNGQMLVSAQVDQLIQAMATFSQQTGLTWDQALDQRPQDVQTVLAASWQ